MKIRPKRGKGDLPNQNLRLFKRSWKGSRDEYSFHLRFPLFSSFSFFFVLFLFLFSFFSFFFPCFRSFLLPVWSEIGSVPHCPGTRRLEPPKRKKNNFKVLLTFRCSFSLSNRCLIPRFFSCHILILRPVLIMRHPLVFMGIKNCYIILCQYHTESVCVLQQ